jgi:hypothetical protein
MAHPALLDPRPLYRALRWRTFGDANQRHVLDLDDVKSELVKVLAGFDGPNAAAKAKVDSGKVTIAGKEIQVLAPGRKDLVFAISQLLDLDQVHSLELLVYCLGKRDQLNEEVYSGELLLDVCEEYYDRRAKLLLLLQEMLQIAADDSHPYKESVELATANWASSFFGNCMTSLQKLLEEDVKDRERQVRKDLLRSNSRVQVKFARDFKQKFEELWMKRLVEEQQHLLDVMFWAFYIREVRVGLDT